MARWQVVDLCSASDSTSFAYESTVKRWPQILTGVIDELATINGAVEDREKVKESQGIIAGIAGLIYEIRHDRQLSPIPGSYITQSTR